MLSFISNLSFFTVLLLSIQAFASPVASNDRFEVKQNQGGKNNNFPTAPFSLNRWGGFGQLEGFDDFFGINNFDGSHNKQFFNNDRVVCNAQQLIVVQQQLSILQEFAKKIITEQVCEVEVQSIIFDQFNRGFDLFRRDLRRENGRQPGYDHDIARLIIIIIDDNGNFRDRRGKDYGFNGRDIGRNFVIPSGHNWRGRQSLESLALADKATQAAFRSTKF